MSDLTQGTSGYSIGQIDTATPLVNGVSPRRAEHVNGPAAAAVQIEQVLGSALTLKGSLADLAARLAVSLNASGTLKLDTPSGLSGILGVPNGGSGVSAATAGKVFLGNGTAPVAFGSGLHYQGPTSSGSGSSQAHEGVKVITSNQSINGVHYYTDFTLNSGITLSAGNTSGFLCIVASGTVTINGTIDGVGAGITAGRDGITEPGGGGGGGAGGGGQTAGNAGGDAVGIITGASGGAIASTGGTGITGGAIQVGIVGVIGGGAGGGNGGQGANGASGGAGGAGGASISIIAPTIILGAASTLTTRGGNGSQGGSSAPGAGGGGGGGGAGHIYLACVSYTNNGCTFTTTGGSGGSGGSVGGAGSGGAGGAGRTQISIYG